MEKSERSPPRKYVQSTTYLHKLWIVHVLNISGKRKKCTFALWKKYSRPARRTSSQNPYLCQKPTQGRTALRYKNGYINALAITWRHHTQYKMPIKSDISTLYQLRQYNLKLLSDLIWLKFDHRNSSLRRQVRNSIYFRCILFLLKYMCLSSTNWIRENRSLLSKHIMIF